MIRIGKAATQTTIKYTKSCFRLEFEMLDYYWLHLHM